MPISQHENTNHGCRCFFERVHHIFITNRNNIKQFLSHFKRKMTKPNAGLNTSASQGSTAQYQAMRRAKLLDRETPEEKAERLRIQAERTAIWRKSKWDAETPEERTQRLAMEAQRTRDRRRLRKEVETDEERRSRLDHEKALVKTRRDRKLGRVLTEQEQKDQAKRKRAEKRAAETEEQRRARLDREAELTRRRRAAKKKDSRDDNNVHHDIAMRGPTVASTITTSAPTNESLSNLSATSIVSTAVISESSMMPASAVASSSDTLAKKRRTEEAASLPLSTSIDMTAIATGMQPPIATATAIGIGESVAPKKRGRVKATDSQIEDVITDKANARDITGATF